MERKNRYLLEHILLSVTIELPGEINKKKILVPYDQFYKTTFSNRKIDATIDRPPESESEPESVTKQGKITESELPIALRKKKRSCAKYPMSAYDSISSISLSLANFTTNVSSITIPTGIHEALSKHE